METLKPTRGKKNRNNEQETTRGGPQSQRSNSNNSTKQTKQTKDENYGFKYLHNEQLARSGNWGGSNVYQNTSDMTSQLNGVRDQLKQRYDQIYSHQEFPAECFIAQICFTHLNTFLLTTDGRIFSWGGITFCLGRDPTNQSEKVIGEIEGLHAPIVKIATGRNHVIALDAKGKVFSWGKNDHGQLGHNDKEQSDRELPKHIEKLKNIVQIYAGENMSFAVDKFGSTYAWGENKHNLLMLDENEKVKSKTKIEEPTEIKFPDYFIKSKDGKRNDTKSMQITLNNQNGVTMYMSKRPVKSVASETQQELDRVSAENKKLQSRLKELEKKIAKIGTNDQLNNEEQEINRNLQNDKVIQNLNTMIKKIEKDSQRAFQESQILNKDLKSLNSEIESYNKQLSELEAKEKDFLKSGGNQGAASRDKKKELQEANNALKSSIHQKLVESEKKRYEKQQKVDEANRTMDDITENITIYKNILEERKRYKVSEYIKRSQDDLERILSTLHQHFENVKLTSFEVMSRDNQDYGGSKEILKKSNLELKRLLKELEAQKVEKEDIRYDIFQMIYEMIGDDIDLRIRVNNYIEGILEQTNQKLEKYVSTYKKKKDNTKKKQGIFASAGDGNIDIEEEEKKRSEFERRKQQRVIEFSQKNEKKYRVCS